MAEESRRITDPDTLKVFTHPLRLRLHRALRAAGEATASQLGQQIGEQTSLVSYHLRKLAEHGFVEEAEGHGTDGRERWWRPAVEGWTYSVTDFRGDPEDTEAADALTRMLLGQRSEQFARYLAEQSRWSERWNSASFSSEHLLRLTAAELKQLSEDMFQLVRRYSESGAAAEAAGDTEGREHVAVHTYGFPFHP